MSARTVSHRTRLFVVAGLAWFVGSRLAVAVGYGRRVAVVLGLHGFVLHVAFGKAYSLVPAYFDRDLRFPYPPAVHLPLAVGGTAGLAADGEGLAQSGAVGAVAWALGCAVLVGALGWSVRDNLLGRETGTAAAKASRHPVDRLANLFVPVALLYLLLGSVLPALGAADLDPPVATTGPPVSHLLATGGAALLLFAVGFRLLPRFLVVEPRRPLVWLVLPAGAAGPALLAADFLGGAVFAVGAGLQALALLGFAAAYLEMYRRSDRRRVDLLDAARRERDPSGDISAVDA